MKSKKKPIIEYRHYHLPVDFPILLLDGERWHISDVRSDRLHFHNCLEIGICHTEEGIMEFKDQRIPFKAGDISCVPRFLPHTTYSTEGKSSLWSYIFFAPEELFNDLFQLPGSDFEKPVANLDIQDYILHQKDYPILHSILLKIIEELQEKKPFYHESIKGLLTYLYIELLRIYTKKTTSLDTGKELHQDKTFVISPVLEFIRQHYMEDLMIDDLAERCHLSTPHFRRIFKDIMGASPLEFMNSLRIDHACKYLSSTEDSILTISDKVGFNSVSSFNRNFSKYMGMPPREWRKQLATEESATSSILEFKGWL